MKKTTSTNIIMVILFILILADFKISLLSYNISASAKNNINLSPEFSGVKQYVFHLQDQKPLSSNNINTVLKAAFSELKTKTRVPIKLPGYLGNESEPSKLFAVIKAADDFRYEILLGFTPDCDGGNYCRWGIVRGEKSEGGCANKGTSVMLAKKIKGRFIDATCGAVCSDSTLSWKQEGYCYTVGIKAGKVGKLIKMANSAISDK